MLPHSAASPPPINLPIGQRRDVAFNRLPQALRDELVRCLDGGHPRCVARWSEAPIWSGHAALAAASAVVLATDTFGMRFASEPLYHAPIWLALAYTVGVSLACRLPYTPSTVVFPGFTLAAYGNGRVAVYSTNARDSASFYRDKHPSYLGERIVFNVPEQPVALEVRAAGREREAVKAQARELLQPIFAWDEAVKAQDLARAAALDPIAALLNVPQWELPHGAPPEGPVFRFRPAWFAAGRRALRTLILVTPLLALVAAVGRDLVNQLFDHPFGP